MTRPKETIHLVIVEPTLALGGVTSLLLRIAREMKRSGDHRITWLVAQPVDPALSVRLKEVANLVILPRWTFLAPSWARPVPQIPEPTALFATSLEGWALASHLQPRWPMARLVLGAYHPAAFAESSWSHPMRSRAVRRAMKALPKQNLVVMNEGVRRAFESRFGQPFGDAPLVPLAVPVPRGLPADRAKRGRVLSVGRYVPFKTFYKETMHAVADLAAEGLEVDYHIYGYGPGERELRREAARFPGLVKIHGPVALEHLDAVLASASVFVGMGTTVVEASAQGVPSIVVPADAVGDTAYGLLPELGTLNLGEVDDQMTVQSLRNCLRTVVSANGPGRKAMRAAAHATALRFSVEESTARLIGAIMGGRRGRFTGPSTRLGDLVDLPFRLVGRCLRRVRKTYADL